MTIIESRLYKMKVWIVLAAVLIVIGIGLYVYGLAAGEQTPLAFGSLLAFVGILALPVGRWNEHY